MLGILMAAQWAKIAYMMGDVKVVRAGLEQPARIGMILESGDKIKTGAESKVMLRLSTGSRIKLAASSELVVDELFGSNSVFTATTGKILFRVAKHKDKVFKVKTNAFVAGVRGTQFAVFVDEGGAELVVLEGAVAVNDMATGRRILVRQNQSVSGKAGAGVGAPRSLPPARRKKVLGMFAKAAGRKMLKRELVRMRLARAEQRRRIRKILNRIRNADMRAGRVVRDAYGNVVYVVQLLERPDLNKVVLTNISLRRNYRYGFAANPWFQKHILEDNPSIPKFKIDVISYGALLDFSLPRRVNEWPRALVNYISEKNEVGEEIEPVLKGVFVMRSSGVGFKSITDFVNDETRWYAMKEGKVYDMEFVTDEDLKKWGLEDYKPRVYSPFRDAETREEALKQPAWVAIEGVPLVKVDFNRDGVYDKSELVYVNMEVYLLGRKGVASLNKILNSSSSPFDLLKKGAVQVVLTEAYWKYPTATRPKLLSTRNHDFVPLDNVLIANLFVKIAREVAKGAATLAAEESSNTAQ